MQGNADRLAALRGFSSAQSTTTYYSAYAAASAAARAAAAASASSAAAAQSKQKPIMATYCCCICITQFERDVTNDPDPRPSPLGDTCDSCRAAGKLRPFEAAGMTISSVMVPKCRVCNGDHWAMDCSNN
jgi:hypothetical protein